jgi:hypothetical protein
MIHAPSCLLGVPPFTREVKNSKSPPALSRDDLLPTHRAAGKSGILLIRLAESAPVYPATTSKVFPRAHPWGHGLRRPHAAPPFPVSVSGPACRENLVYYNGAVVGENPAGHTYRSRQ